ncbi:hypothetical protein KRR38_24550 [Novosphingobium sp. G106]|uniref:hypothetical protein n=1 Tax=Novosphingobium sp. G106 TaxID=2849500 RepID=UPI001C2D8AEA|nr:hypothetical protein [Novosphingobium sp. G106]MBV1690760.1 hypothetical protein [Novosphingobium sp. G106]
MATGKVKAGAAKVGGAAKQTVAKAGETAGKAGSAVKTTAKKAGTAARNTADKAGTAIKQSQGFSPNPMTNLIIADVALRGGGRLLRHVVERTLLGVKYPPDKARDIVKSRSMAQTLVGTAVARVATRSVPGALLIGGGLIAKALYDRSQKRSKAKVEGDSAVDEQANNGKSRT